MHAETVWCCSPTCSAWEPEGGSRSWQNVESPGRSSGSAQRAGVAAGIPDASRGFQRQGRGNRSVTPSGSAKTYIAFGAPGTRPPPTGTARYWRLSTA